MCQSAANTVYLYLCHSACCISSRLSAIYNISKAHVLVVYHGKFLATNVHYAPPRSNVMRMCESTKNGGKNFCQNNKGIYRKTVYYKETADGLRYGVSPLFPCANEVILSLNSRNFLVPVFRVYKQ